MRNFLKNKKLFFCSSDKSGCSYYRTKLPAEFLKQEYRYGYLVSDERIDQSDIIFLQRTTSEDFLEIIPKLQASNKKVVYDIDDNLWQIPASNPAHHAYNNQTLKIVKKIIGLCDGVTVSTEPLKDYFIKNKFHDNIHVIPNFINDVFDYKELNNPKPIIGFCGTKTHAGDFNYHLCKALRSLKNKCDFVFVGYNPILGMDSNFIQWVDTEKYHETIYNLNIDISIAPLYNDTFNSCKSNIKFLEMGSMSSAFVGSDVYPYSKTIDDGIDGIIIKSDKEWLSKLEGLIEDIEYRKTISRNARYWIKNNFTYKYNGDYILDKYYNLLESL